MKGKLTLAKGELCARPQHRCFSRNDVMTPLESTLETAVQRLLIMNTT